MSLKLEPLLVPKTRTPCCHCLQQFVPKSIVIFGAKNWNRCDRACTIARLCASCEGVKIGIAQISTTDVIWFRRLLNHMRDGRCTNVCLTALCKGAFLKSRACSHRVLGCAPTGHSLPPNTRGSQLILVRYINAATGPHGLSLGRCSIGRPRGPSGRSASRVQPIMCLRT